MQLTRRGLCAAIAAGSSLAFVSATKGFSAAGSGHSVAVETNADDAHLSVEPEARSEDATEPATVHISSSLSDVTLVELSADSLVFDLALPCPLPQTVAVTPATGAGAQTTSIVQAAAKAGDTRVETWQRLTVETADSGSEL